MSLKLYLDADLNLLKLEAQTLDNVNVPLPALGESLHRSMPALAGLVAEAIQSNFINQQNSPKFALYNLGLLQVAHYGHVWGFNCWSFLGAIRKGFYLEGSPVTGFSQDSTRPSHYDFSEIQSLRGLAELAELPILQLDARWHTIYANDALCHLYGKRLDDLSLHGWLEMFHEDDQADYLEALFHHSKSGNAFQVELRFRDMRGQVFTMLTHNCPVFNSSGMLDSVIVLLLRNNKTTSTKNRHLILKDALTGLENRYGLLQLTEAELKQFFVKSKIAIFHIDVDGLNRVNSMYGQMIGNDLIKQLSKRLKGVLRGTDSLARLSYDEFAILVREANSNEEYIAIANRIFAMTADHYILPEGMDSVPLSASLGIRVYDGAEFSNVPISSEIDLKKQSVRILEQAEVAMYQARDSGHNRYCFYSSEQSSDQTSMGLSNALHRAVEMSEFELYYQPLLDISAKRFYGYEGLIRWPGASWKTERFIQALEDSNLIHRMGRWVVKRSIQQFSQFLQLITADQPKPILSINISPMQFYETDLVKFIADTLLHYGIAPHLVTLEITERLLSDTNVDVEGRLREMKQLGLLIALDDFGTGYSSLAYLYRFPIDVIKIDKSFVCDLGRYESRQIVDAIINLGRALGKVTLAEGVETEQQLEVLCEQQCQVIQGWLYSPVVSFVGLRHFYSNHAEVLEKINCLKKTV